MLKIQSLTMTIKNVLNRDTGICHDHMYSKGALYPSDIVYKILHFVETIPPYVRKGGILKSQINVKSIVNMAIQYLAPNINLFKPKHPVS